MSPITLRSRTTLLATALTMAVLALGSVALVVTLDARLTAGADDLARSRALDLVSLAASGDLPRELTNAGEDGVAQVVIEQDREVVAASPNIRGAPPIASFSPADGLEVREVRAPDDAETETYRLWGARGESSAGPVAVYVGTSLESVHEATQTLRRALLVGAPLGGLLIGLGTWVAVGRALRRIDRIRADVDAITAARLGSRVSGSGGGDEVGRLATTMNRMLDRLAAASARQRDFVADVSHDLQSPLATQRAQLEVALSAGPDGLDADTTRQLLGTTAEMERLVADLLVLAAADAGLTGDGATLLDLDVIVLEEVARATTLSPVGIDTRAVSAAPVRARAGDLHRVVRNLLDNAIEHASTLVRILLRVEGGAVCLEVADDGPGIPPADRERVFDRFQRGDPARPRRAGARTSGTGLGLAIARTLTEKAGGTLVVESGQQGARFVLRLPAEGV